MTTHVCIITRNRADECAELLTSDHFLWAVDPAGAVVHLLENGSDKPTPGLLRHWFPFNVYRTEENIGVPAARRYLVDKVWTHPMQADCIVFLDDDVRLRDRYWLDKLTAPIERGQAAVVGSDCMKVTDDWHTGPCKPSEIEYVSGYGWAISMDVFARGVNFDLRYEKAYWEDVDFCYEARKLGFGVMCVDSGIEHEATRSEAGDLIFAQNSVKFRQKWERF